MVKLRLKLLFGLLLIFSLLHMFKCNNASFLGVRQRFNDSSHYDYLYYCNICGEGLRWSVDGAEVINHLASQTNVGSVGSVNSGVNSNSLRYSSSILSKRIEGNQACYDAVFVYTQDRSDLEPVVKCHSGNRFYPVQYQNFTNEVEDVTNSSVTVRNTKNSHRDVVSPGNNCSTQIVMCRTSGDILRWNNDTFSALFNGISRAGSKQFERHPLDNNTALWNAVILEKTEEYIASAIMWTDYISAGSYHIKCESSFEEVATTMVNTPPINVQTTEVPVSTSTSDPESSLPSVSISLVSGYEPVSYYMTSVVAALMITILCF